MPNGVPPKNVFPIYSRACGKPDQVDDGQGVADDPDDEGAEVPAQPEEEWAEGGAGHQGELLHAVVAGQLGGAGDRGCQAGPEGVDALVVQGHT